MSLMNRTEEVTKNRECNYRREETFELQSYRSHTSGGRRAKEAGWVLRSIRETVAKQLDPSRIKSNTNG